MHFPFAPGFLVRITGVVERVAKAVGWAVSLFHPPWHKSPPKDAVPPRPPDTGKETTVRATHPRPNLSYTVYEHDPNRGVTATIGRGRVGVNGETRVIAAKPGREDQIVYAIWHHQRAGFATAYGAAFVEVDAPPPDDEEAS